MTDTYFSLYSHSPTSSLRFSPAVYYEKFWTDRKVHRSSQWTLFTYHLDSILNILCFLITYLLDNWLVEHNPWLYLIFEFYFWLNFLNLHQVVLLLHSVLCTEMPLIVCVCVWTYTNIFRIRVPSHRHPSGQLLPSLSLLAQPVTAWRLLLRCSSQEFILIHTEQYIINSSPGKEMKQILLDIFKGVSTKFVLYWNFVI